MMDPKEKDFLAYWEKNRKKNRKWIHTLSVGLPLGVTLVVAIFVNLLSGWYGRAQMEFFRENSSLIIILMLASLGIVIFIVIFAARHRWEMNEQRYQELQAQEKQNSLTS